MPSSRSKQAAEPAAPSPPFYIADVPLPVAGEMGAEALPPRAFNPGDHVPAEHVARFGWQSYVHAPEGDWTPAAEPPAGAGTEE
jgi:hypothetical protein